jgi:hypothetical protein
MVHARIAGASQNCNPECALTNESFQFAKKKDGDVPLHVLEGKYI